MKEEEPGNQEGLKLINKILAHRVFGHNLTREQCDQILQALPDAKVVMSKLEP